MSKLIKRYQVTETKISWGQARKKNKNKEKQIYVHYNQPVENQI